MSFDEVHSRTSSRRRTRPTVKRFDPTPVDHDPKQLLPDDYPEEDHLSSGDEDNVTQLSRALSSMSIDGGGGASETETESVFDSDEEYDSDFVEEDEEYRVMKNGRGVEYDDPGDPTFEPTESELARAEKIIHEPYSAEDSDEAEDATSSDDD